MEIYERIRGLREDSDLNQETIAKYLGITRPQYSLYETGKRAFPAEQIAKLCKFFHVSADYVLDIPPGMPYGKSKTNK